MCLHCDTKIVNKPFQVYGYCDYMDDDDVPNHRDHKVGNMQIVLVCREKYEKCINREDDCDYVDVECTNDFVNDLTKATCDCERCNLECTSDIHVFSDGFCRDYCRCGHIYMSHMRPDSLEDRCHIRGGDCGGSTHGNKQYVDVDKNNRIPNNATCLYVELVQNSRYVKRMSAIKEKAQMMNQRLVNEKIIETYKKNTADLSKYLRFDETAFCWNNHATTIVEKIEYVFSFGWVAVFNEIYTFIRCLFASAPHLITNTKVCEALDNACKVRDNAFAQLNGSDMANVPRVINMNCMMAFTKLHTVLTSI